MKHSLAAALGTFALLACAAHAQAQQPGPNQGPTYGPGSRNLLSPYLNLFRGQNTGIDYYNGTRAEQQRRANAQQFREEIDDLDRRGTADPFDDGSGRQTPVQSGTPTTFGSTMGYYTNRQNYVAPTAGRMGAGVGQAAPPSSRGRR